MSVISAGQRNISVYFKNSHTYRKDTFQTTDYYSTIFEVLDSPLKYNNMHSIMIEILHCGTATAKSLQSVSAK